MTSERTSKRIRIGVQIQPEHADYTAIRRAVRGCEDLGADVIFTWDHFFPLSGDPDGRHFECWTMLAAWAESTSRAEIGTLVTCNAYRNPELLADMARTVDHISGGRLVLGIGSGWFERDFTDYGYEFGTAGARLNELAEALPRIERRMSLLNPPPVRGIPVLIGGEGEKKTLPMVARHADIWHAFADPDTLARKTKVLNRCCADIGRDPAEIERSVAVNSVELGVHGTPEELGPRLAGLGVTLFTVGVGGPDFDMGLLRSWLAWRDGYEAQFSHSCRHPTSSSQ
ncbi:LLM class F420-dependent oxidoreductase [Streptomyces acidicola]|uniref:LLM class F420-dependent oxidoreductase n=1 Tax=Streptomyces acidicola TaxID=2596892 RepID=UPI00381FF9AE